jgi:hypothetical protein
MSHAFGRRGESTHAKATLVWAFADTTSTTLIGTANRGNSNWSVIANWRSSDGSSLNGQWTRTTGRGLWGSARNPHKCSARVWWSVSCSADGVCP